MSLTAPSTGGADRRHDQRLPAVGRDAARFIESRVAAARGRHLTRSAYLVSKRENDVLDAIVENLSNKEIAVRLNISERTVKLHVSNLLAKFHVGRRSDLIRLFPRSQLPQ